MLRFRIDMAMLAPVVLTVMFYLLEKRTAFGRMKYAVRQSIIGLSYGILACLATQFGIPYDGFVLNVRSVAPLTAGLIFGAPAGLISGVLGAAYRWFSVLWGIPSYTRVACTVATLLAGVLGAICRKYMFENKKPTWLYGTFIAIVTEVFHMLLVFITHMDDISRAFIAVRTTAGIMITANALSMLLSIVAVTLLCGEKPRIGKKHTVPITQTFSAYLFICVIASFLATSQFAYKLQKNVSLMQTENLLTVNVRDVRDDIESGMSIQDAVMNRHIGQTGYVYAVTGDGLVCSENDVPENMLLSGEIADKADFEVYFPEAEDDNGFYYMKAEGSGYIVVGCLPESEMAFTRDISVYISSFDLLLVFFVLFVDVFFLIKKVVIDNIHRINDSLSEITDGDLSIHVDIRKNEEFASLSDDINATVERLKQFISDAEKRIDMELAFAKTIQHSVLPSVFPPFPNHGEIDIYAAMRTAKEVGGDFYDFYLLDDDRLGFLMADVSGKGIPSAMFMMNAKSVIKNLAESNLPVSEIITEANNRICATNEAEMFVTAWMGILDLNTGVVKYTNAGHNPPLVRHGNGEFEYLRSKPCLVLGGMEGIPYRENEFQLEPGDEIFLYTDGVTEATSADTELFGEKRLKQTLNARVFVAARDVCDEVLEKVLAFTGEAPQFDDITVMSLKYRGKTADKTPDTGKTMTVDALPENLDVLTEFVDAELEAAEAPYKALLQLNVALDEIFSNIVKFAYPGMTGKVTVRVDIADGTARVTLSDSGIPFNPLDAEEPDVTASAEERDIGGLGIFMVRKAMDDVVYRYADGQNHLTLIKKIGGETQIC